MFSIRYKILLVVLPLLLVSLIILTNISVGFARTGITKVATEFLGYKMNEVIQKANNELDNLKNELIPGRLNSKQFYSKIINPLASNEDRLFIQSIYTEKEGTYILNNNLTLSRRNRLWEILVKINYENINEFIQIIKESVQEYAASITRKNSQQVQYELESFIAVDSKGVIQLSTDSFLAAGSEIDFFNIIKSSETEWVEFTTKNMKKIGFFKYFEDWDYYFLLSVYSSTFYKDANTILKNSIYILLISMVIMSIILFLVINFILNPLKKIVSAMDDIIKLNDLSNRVAIEYNDEIGEMAFTFNNMLEELQGAHNTIKEYAYKTTLSQLKEERIKNMFQKYVPQDVVNEIVHNPDTALVGKNANLTVLFSDIRSFTTISESMSPEKLVDSLNKYFTIMVDIIYKRRGVIDKYIGDAIMAIFGAPKEYGDDTQQAVLAALEMLDNLEKFNSEQRKAGITEFHIGIGVNYGPVTVGNIGTIQKMDYTVIGDAVNLASRLEGLTKAYQTPLVISEGTYEAVKDYFYVREIDRVRVKGKIKPVKIYEPSRKLNAAKKEGWRLYNQAVKLFLLQEWEESEKTFIKALNKLNGRDFLTEKYLNDIKYYRAHPPPANWDGTTTMTHK